MVQISLVDQIADKKGVGGRNATSISDSEQRRIIEQSGVMRQVPARNQPQSADSYLITAALVLIYAVLQVAVYMQFGKDVSLSLQNEQFIELLKRTLGASPAVFCIVYFAHKHTKNQWMQFTLLLVSIVFGVYNLSLMTRIGATYQSLMMSPGLGTVWTYSLMEMRLSYAVVSLLVTLTVHVVTMFNTL